MASKPSENGVAASNEPKADHTPTESLASIEAKLDDIVKSLHRIDRRDRLRLWGGTLRTLLYLIPRLIFLFRLWYVYNHTDELIRIVSRRAAQQAVEMSREQADGFMESSGNLFEELQRYFSGEDGVEN